MRLSRWILVCAVAGTAATLLLVPVTAGAADHLTWQEDLNAGAAARVRPGGLICMHEADLAYPSASPLTPLWSQTQGYFLLALEKAGIEQRMGLVLFTAFRAAGLPAPDLLIESFGAGGPEAPAWAWANVMSAAVPLMERFGVATRAEVDPPTLADRLLAETLAHDGCVIGPPVTGAWVTVPGA